MNKLNISAFQLIVAIFFMFPLFVNAQNQNQLPLKQLNVATPEAAMLGKFENIAVSNYTGVPDISIPLYTVKVAELEIPIVIKYNSSGIKVDEEATWVGLGWNLSIGGSITHIPIGADDDIEQAQWNVLDRYDQLMSGYKPPNFKSYTGRAEKGWVWAACVASLMNADDDSYSTFLYVNKYKFGSPDVYNYQLPTTSGKFFLKPVTHVPTLFGAINSVESIIKGTNSWSIFDMNGIKYLFNSSDKEISQNMSIDNTFTPFSSITWRVSSILLPAGKTVNFSYDDGVSSKWSYFDNFVKANEIYSNSANLNLYRNAAKYLSKIETDKEKIIFELSADREDLKSSDYPGDQSMLPKRLNAIHIFDKMTNKKIKTFRFIYDYFVSSQTPQPEMANYKRLRLLSIQEVGYTASGTEVTKSPYVFDYNQTLLPEKGSKAIDHWGYYNGRTNNQIYLPDLSKYAYSGLIKLTDYPEIVQKMIIDDEVLTGVNYIKKANRGMDPAFANAEILTKITYPTGGYRILNYEANDFTNYPVLSALEEESNSLCTFINVADLNNPICNSQPSISSYFYPDSQGLLKLMDISVGISRIISSITYTDMMDSYIKIVKVDLSGVKTDILVWALLGKMDEFNNNNGQVRWAQPYFEYSGATTDRYYAEAYLPNITILTPGDCSSLKAQASGSFNCPNTSITKSTSIGGGLRIASQEAFNLAGKKSSKTIYNYLNNNGTSTSGKMMAPLSYTSFYRIVEKSYTCSNGQFVLLYNNYIDQFSFTMASNSYTPLAYDASGAVIGYDRVEVTDVDNSESSNNGKTIYFYKNNPSAYSSKYFNVPNLPYYDNGLADSVIYLNNTGQKVKEVTNIMQFNKNELAYGVVIGDNYRGPDICQPTCSPLGGDATNNPFAYPNRWEVIYYPIHSAMYVNSKATEINYFPGSNNSIVTEKLMTFNSLGQLASQSMTQSNGNISETKFRYPFDIATGYYASMVNSNMLNFQLEKTDLMNSNIVNSTLTTYRPNGGTFVPDKLFQLETTTPLSAFSYFDGTNKDSHYGQIPAIDFDSYDNSGNLLQYRKGSGSNNSVIWGYNSTFPIAEIANSLNHPGTFTTSQTNSSFYTYGGNTSGTVQCSITSVAANTTATLTLTTLIDPSLPTQNQTLTFSLYNSTTQAPATTVSLSSTNKTATFTMSAGDYVLSYSNKGVNVIFGGTFAYTKTIILTNETIEFDYTGFENHEAPGWVTSASWSIVDELSNLKTGGSSAKVTGNGPAKYFTVGNSAGNHNGYRASVWVKGGTDAYLYIQVNDDVSLRKGITNPNVPAGSWNLIQVELPYIVYKNNISPTMKIKMYCGSSNTAYFDDLRFFPMDAQMTSYTYAPLIGVTSINDVDNKPSTYEYDELGRLIVVRDYTGSILKKFDYHYYNQAATVNSYITVTPSVLPFDKSASSQNVTVSSSPAWSISQTTGSFITATKIDATTLQISCSANSSSSRNGTVTLTNGQSNAVISISQSNLLD